MSERIIREAIEEFERRAQEKDALSGYGIDPDHTVGQADAYERAANYLRERANVIAMSEGGE